jgi:DNA-binding transcriptional LysR family regulator
MHLKYAVEVEKTGSITKAAKRLYINQPNLSKTIRELEETLGFTIFKRTPKGIMPTKKGTEFLACAKNILFQLGRMENMAEGSVRTYLNISAPRASYISCALAEFIGSLPEDRVVDIDYRETSSFQAIENVSDGESDIGIIRCRGEDERYFMELFRERNLRFELVNHFEYLLLFSERHELAGCDVICCQDLEKYIEITHEDANSPSKRIQRSNRTGGRISVYERGSRLELLDKIPRTYMWTSPVPASVMKTFSLVQRRSDMPYNNHNKDFLVYRSDYRFIDEDSFFVEKLLETAEITSSIV